MEWVAAHTVHLVPLLGLGAWFGWNGVARSRARRARPAGSSPPPVPVDASLEVRLALMACSVGAAVVHADVIGSHFRESALYGWFFSLSALAQFAWGVLVVRRADRPLLVCGLVGNGLIVLLWLVTRTTGLPVGPRPWRPESVGAFDGLATALEVALVVGAGALLAGRARTRRSRLKM